MNRISLITLAVLCAVTYSARAVPPDLYDLKDRRAGSAERDLQDRGYHHHKTLNLQHSSIGYWWSPRHEQCVAVTIKDGYVDNILKQPEQMCGDERERSRFGRDDYRDRHDYRDDHNRHGDHEMHADLRDLKGMRASSGEGRLKELGYFYRHTVKTGVSSIAYWWSPQHQRCIAVTTRDGHYENVMNQPVTMCDDSKVESSGHHGGNVHDLVGMRASSGENELKNRGYEFVNSTKSGDRIWSNWWHHSDRKCITVVTKDGRYDAVTDSLPADCNKR